MPTVYIRCDRVTGRWSWELLSQKLDSTDYPSLKRVTMAVRLFFPKYKPVIVGIGRYVS